MKTYKTTIENGNIDIIGKETITDYKDFDLTISDFVIEYEIYLEERSWCVKGISANVIKISGSVFVQDMETSEEKEIICNDFEKEYEMEDKIPFSIDELLIDLETRIITFKN